MGLLQNLCVFAGVLTPPPAPLAPAHAGFCTGKWYACVVVVRLMCRKVSPSAAFSGDRRDEICPTSATFGEEIPQTPLSRRSIVRRRIAAACNARRNSYGVTAILERQFQNSLYITPRLSDSSSSLWREWVFQLVGAKGEELLLDR